MSNDIERFSALIKSLRSEWQARSIPDLEFSEDKRNILFAELRRISIQNGSSISWELAANYFQRFSLASATIALCFAVTFQVVSRDIGAASFNERIESDAIELIAGSDQSDDFDLGELIIDTLQGEEV